MRYFSIAIIAAASAIATTTIAAAADLPLKEPVSEAPVVAPVTSWEGFYFGGHVGYGWDPADGTFNPVTYVTSAVPPLFINSSSGPVNLSVDPEGWLGGVQIGYNWQRDSWVYGLEADFSWSDIEDSDSAPWFVNSSVGAAGAQGLALNITGIVRLKQKLDYFGTFRGRIGWLANNSLLLYATGGGAWGHVKTEFSNSDISLSGAGVGGLTAAQRAALTAGGYDSASDIRWGFSVGGGAEWMFAQNWSVKAEYLFVDLLGSDTLNIVGGTATAGDMEVHTARLGVNWHFHAQ
jgi:outer membrane immunogenic protein